MPLSNYLASSRISQPGVCTSSTRPVSPYQGQVIYQTDTNTTHVWNGSAWVFLSTSSAGDVGLVKIVPTGATNGTVGANGDITIGNATNSVTITNAFSSTYDNYKVIVTGGAASTNVSITVAFGGVTTGYYGGLTATKYDTNAVSGLGVNNGASWTYAGFGDVNSLGLTADLLNVSLTDRKYIASGFSLISAGAYYGSFAGECTSTAAATSLVIGSSGGTMTGGTIRVYGYRN